MKPTQNCRTPRRWNTVSVPPRVAERAYTRREITEGGCWISTYSIANHGYAQIGWSTTKAEQANGSPRRHMVLAHRAAWTHINGQVPIGMTIDHLCKTRPCVNPDHMRLLSNYENARRNDGTDWGFGRCRHGHPDTELREVKRTAKSGREYIGLSCRACRRESSLRWVEKNPDKARAVRDNYQEAARAKKREWYLANRELVIARAAENRKKRRTAKEEV